MSLIKDQLRKEIRLKSSTYRCKEKEEKIAEHLIESPLFIEADTVFLYAALKSEISVDKIATQAEKLGKKTAFPFCEDRDGEMKFYFTELGKLKEGMYGIREPDKKICEEAFFTEKSLCIVPGLAFSKKGERLGKGKGYYDRFLMQFSGKTVGVSLEETVYESIPTEKHDIKIDYLVTENKIYKTSKEE